MEDFFAEATDYTPEINFKAKTGILSIKGDCYHEYVAPFFHPVFEWIKKYLSEPGKTIQLNFKLEYFNTSASRRFQEIIDILEEYQIKKKGKVTVNWYYDKNSIDALDAGNDFSKGVRIKFNMIPV
jgi:hypothetical protein